MVETYSGTKHASCHCGTVVLELNLRDGILKPRRCNCSICRRKSAVVASVKLADLRVISGNDKLSLYQFNTHTAKHYFCSICGIYTHHQRRSDPTEFGYNVANLTDFDFSTLGEITIEDGVNHPSDQ